MPYQVNATLILVIALAVVMTGCASPEQARHFEPVVYPPPPDEPRYIFERTLLYNDDVEVYSSGMKFRQFATGATRKLMGLVKPYDIAVRQGRVYVTDTVQRAVFLFDIAGKRFREIGNEKPGDLVKPLGIDLDSNGNIYVCDIGTQNIKVYDPEGGFLRTIGSSEDLLKPSDVVISPDNQRLYVVDTGGVNNDKHFVHVYDVNNGEHIQTIGRRGEGKGEFNLPLQADVAPDGTLYVVDGGNFRIEAFDPEGKFVSSFGELGRFPGQFARPKGISTDSSGNIYVIDTAFGNAQIFNSSGQLLMFIGERGDSGLPGRFMLPAGIDVDEDGRVYIVDQFFRKVDIFRPYSLGEHEGYAANPLN